MDLQAIVLADLRDQLDLHGISQAQQALQERLNGNGSAPAKRLVSTDTSFREVPPRPAQTLIVGCLATSSLLLKVCAP